MTISTETFIVVNTGSVANDGTGDSLRSAFNKVNENFTNITDVGLDTGNINVNGDIESTGNISIAGNVLCQLVSTVDLFAHQVYLLNDLTLTDGNFYVNGSINLNGAWVETKYEQFKPTANIALLANVNTSRLLLHPTGTITSFGANVYLPNTQVDGTIFSISSNVEIASLGITPLWNGVVKISPFGNISSIPAGTNIQYMYIAADYTWYRIAS